MEFFWNDVSLQEPTLRFYWNCNQVKIPMVIQIDQSNPTNFLLQSNLHFLNGKLRFASQSADKPNPKLTEENQILYLKMYNHIKEYYFYRKTMEKEIRLYLDSGVDVSRIEKIRMEFAYLGNSKKRFQYSFPLFNDGFY